jgi:serine/threonine protein kinase
MHQGPHGFVYRCRDAQGGWWALKEFFPRSLARRGDDGSMHVRQASDAISLSVARQAFLDEAQALAAIDHPGLVHVVGVVQAFRTLFQVMPMLDGVPLDQWVAGRAEPLAVHELNELIEGLLGPLSALHSAGIVHGHVRPDQVLMVPEGTPAPVVLLGLGHVARELGTLEDAPWAAPEASARTRSSRITTASDLYAVGACAWLAITGTLPPSAADREAGRSWPIREGLERLVSDLADVPDLRASLTHAIETALAMAPEARPQRVADMRRLMQGDQNVRLVEPTPPPLWVGETPDRDAQRGQIERLDGDEVPRAVPDPAAGATPRRRWIVAGAVVVLLVLAVIVWRASRPAALPMIGATGTHAPATAA